MSFERLFEPGDTIIDKNENSHTFIEYNINCKYKCDGCIGFIVTDKNNLNIGGCGWINGKCVYKLAEKKVKKNLFYKFLQNI